MYALATEWRALTDPATEAGVAQIKLLWWREELGRLQAGAPMHPITRYIAGVAGASSGECALLIDAVDAAAAEVAGAPLERGTELGSHAAALYGAPLLVAARRGSPSSDPGSVEQCIAALAAAQYLARAASEYQREARRGRIHFPVDELLAAGIDDDDLVAEIPSARLQTYLLGLRQRALDYFSKAASALRPADRAELRHLSVLAALGTSRLHRHRSRSSADFHLADLYNAWNAARRAAAAR